MRASPVQFHLTVMYTIQRYVIQFLDEWDDDIAHSCHRWPRDGFASRWTAALSPRPTTGRIFRAIAFRFTAAGGRVVSARCGLIHQPRLRGVNLMDFTRQDSLSGVVPSLDRIHCSEGRIASWEYESWVVCRVRRLVTSMLYYTDVACSPSSRHFSRTKSRFSVSPRAGNCAS